MVWSSKKESKARFGSGRRGLFGASVDRSQNAGALRQSACGGPSIPVVGSEALRGLRVTRSVLRAFVVNLFQLLAHVPIRTSAREIPLCVPL